MSIYFLIERTGNFLLEMTEVMRGRFKSRAKQIVTSFRVFRQQQQTGSILNPDTVKLNRASKQAILEQLRDPTKPNPEVDNFLSEIVADADFVDNCLSECMKTGQVWTNFAKI